MGNKKITSPKKLATINALICWKTSYDVTVLSALPLKSAQAEHVLNTVPFHSIPVRDILVVQNCNSCSPNEIMFW